MERENVAIARFREPDLIQTVEEHCNNVSVLTSKFANSFSMPETGRLIGKIHDIGKFDLTFQKYISSAMGSIEPGEDGYIDPVANRGMIDHSSASGKWMLSNNGLENMEERIPWLISGIVASHHSGLVDHFGNDGTDKFGERMMRATVPTIPHIFQHEMESMKDLAIGEYARFEKSLFDLFEKRFGTLPMGNKKRLMARSSMFQRSMIPRILLSCLIDADRIDAQEFGQGSGFEPYTSNADDYWDGATAALEEYVSSFPKNSEINELRSRVSDECRSAARNAPGIFSLSVPTGGGKTISSLRFALNHAKLHGMERIVYIAPYTTIIEQNAKAVKNALGKYSDGVLEYHSYVSNAMDEYGMAPIDNWDYPIILTTMVQFLDALFGPGASNNRRMHRLSNAVLVFDEIQTIPMKCVHMFNSAIGFLTDFCGSSALLCTATQPLLGKTKIPLGNPIEIVQAKEEMYKELKRVEVEYLRKDEGWSASEIAEKTQNLYNSGSVLVILSTKRAVKRVFSLLPDDMEKYHLSTGMCPAHRMAVIETVKNKLASGERVACVSTQLIEAGVDIDFEYVIRSVAGMDTLMQAAGRCNREGKRSMGKMVVLNPDPSLERIHGMPDLNDGRNIAADMLYQLSRDGGVKDMLTNTSLMDSYFEKYLHGKAESMDYRVDGQAESLFSMLSASEEARHNSNYSGNRPLTPYRTAYSLFEVIDDDTVPVIVPYGEGRQLIDVMKKRGRASIEKKELVKLQRFSITMYRKEFERLLKGGSITDLWGDGKAFILDENSYDDEEGVMNEA